MLPTNNEEYMQWDPMTCVDGGYEICYVIAAPRTPGAWTTEEWWAQENVLVGYSRRLPGGDWYQVDLLPAMPGKRWCAGSIEPNGRMFLSQAGTEGSGAFTQELIYLRNGRVPWRYRPTKSDFSTGLGDRVGCGLFACRDPYYLEANGKHYLYVCSGGYRWNVQPEVIVLRASTIDGPYRVIGPAIRAPEFGGQPAFGELERVSIVQLHDVFWMVAHCWGHQLGPAINRQWAGGLKNADTTAWLFTADNPAGPFRLHAKQPYLLGSDELGLYGLQLKDDGEKTVGYGWNLATHSVTPDCRVTVDWDNLRVTKE